MDKNQLVGIFLIFSIVMVWSILQAPSEAQLAAQKRTQDSLAQVQMTEQEVLLDRPAEIIESQPIVSDSIQRINAESKFGSFAQSSLGESQYFTLENEKIELRLSNKGGKIISAHLKDYFKINIGEDGKDVKSPLFLMNNEKNKFEYLIPSGNRTISTEDLYFEAQQAGNTITFQAKAGNGYIEQKYKLADEGYLIDYSTRFVNMDGVIDANTENITLNWENHLDRLERNDNFEKRYSTIYFKEANEDSDYCSCTGDDEENLDGKSFKWVSHVNQFFNSSLIAKSQTFSGGKFTTKLASEEADELKLVSAQVGIPYSTSSDQQFDMTFFIGPNDFNALHEMDIDLEQIIPFGRSLFGTINRWFIRPFFDFLSSFISSKGIVIILLIFIIKMLLYPLTYKMLHSQAKMGALKPELAHLKEKYKDEPQKVQVETMSIYREYGVSPFGGCFPMLVQMPIWYALFRFFPASLTFRQEPFLWATDLSSYDIITYLPFQLPFNMGDHISLFTILWAITTVMYTYYNTKHMDMSANPAMKYMQYLMPVMFLGFFNTYASGLTCYMFFSNIFNILQTILTKKYVFDDEKIMHELNEKKKIPKKKGGFQARMEEALKQQQLAKENKQQKGKKK